jgi:hypothetical protein
VLVGVGASKWGRIEAVGDDGGGLIEAPLLQEVKLSRRIKKMDFMGATG